jgi:hypothetical protein
MRNFISLAVVAMLLFTSLVSAQDTRTFVPVFFNVNTATVSVDHIEIIKQSLKGVEIDSIVGYASLEGSKSTNERLSAKRASFVASFLGIDMSMDSEIFVGYRGGVDIFGDKDMNRVVLIYFHIPSSPNTKDTYTANEPFKGFVRTVSNTVNGNDMVCNNNHITIDPIVVSVIVKDSSACNCACIPAPVVPMTPIVAPISNTATSKPSSIKSYDDAVKHYMVKGLSLTEAVAKVDETVSNTSNDLYISRGRWNKTNRNAAIKAWEREKAVLLKQSKPLLQ